jgi:Na+-driven multidrug efflux pump
VLGSAITGSGATRTTLVTDMVIVLGFQIPACVLAVVLPGATLDRLWSALAATYMISGAAYVVVFKVAPWIRAAEQRLLAERAEVKALPPAGAPEEAG